MSSPMSELNSSQTQPQTQPQTQTQTQTQNLDGSYIAQVVLTKSGNEKTTKLMSVKVDKKILSS